jgi:hypothetical protein
LASPSLRGRIDPANIYRTGRKIAALGLERDSIRLNDLPADCPFSLEQLLDEDWWPTNRHGLA